jgi:hypothetical protein
VVLRAHVRQPTVRVHPLHELVRALQARDVDVLTVLRRVVGVVEPGIDRLRHAQRVRVLLLAIGRIDLVALHETEPGLLIPRDLGHRRIVRPQVISIESEVMPVLMGRVVVVLKRPHNATDTRLIRIHGVDTAVLPRPRNRQRPTTRPDIDLRRKLKPNLTADHDHADAAIRAGSRSPTDVRKSSSGSSGDTE